MTYNAHCTLYLSQAYMSASLYAYSNAALISGYIIQVWNVSSGLTAHSNQSESTFLLFFHCGLEKCEPWLVGKGIKANFWFLRPFIPYTSVMSLALVNRFYQQVYVHFPVLFIPFMSVYLSHEQYANCFFVFIFRT